VDRKPATDEQIATWRAGLTNVAGTGLTRDAALSLIHRIDADADRLTQAHRLARMQMDEDRFVAGDREVETLSQALGMAYQCLSVIGTGTAADTEAQRRTGRAYLKRADAMAQAQADKDAATIAKLKTDVAGYSSSLRDAREWQGEQMRRAVAAEAESGSLSRSIASMSTANAELEAERDNLLIERDRLQTELAAMKRESSEALAREWGLPIPTVNPGAVIP
jgi:hypothetical protein